MKKGVATTIETILGILIMLFFLMILLALLSKTSEKEIELNSGSLELSKLSNTFYLVNRSLYTTWYVSSVQSLFTAGFEGMGCDYWYQTDPSRSYIGDRAARFPIIFPEVSQNPAVIETYMPNYAGETRYYRMQCTVDGIQTFGECTPAETGTTTKIEISAEYPEGEHQVFGCTVDKFRDSQCSDTVAQGIETVINKKFTIAAYSEHDQERKQTSSNPVVCAPNIDIASDFLNLTLASYKDIRRDARANGLNIHVGSRDDVPDNTDIISGFMIGDRNIAGSVRHEIFMDAPSSNIATSLNHNITIETNASDMLQNAREAVAFLMSVHDTPRRAETLLAGGSLVYEDELYDLALVYIPVVDANSITRDTRQSYENKIWDAMGAMPVMDNLNIDVSSNAFELTSMPEGKGIFLYYDVEITFSDKSSKSQKELFSGFERNDGGILGWLWPTESRRITSCFGETRTSESGRSVHRGVDIGSNGNDEIIVSGLPGETIEVLRVSTGCIEGDGECGGGYGNFVELEHQGGGYKSLYAHLDSVNVNEGDVFNSGTSIGMMGNTGRSTGKHLHFEIIRDGTKLNPCDFIDCSESAAQSCSAGTDDTLTEEVYDSGYYFYNEGENEFVKLPMQLHIKAKDYLPAIDCTTDGLYAYEKIADMMCSGGKLYTCGAANNIEGLDTWQQTPEGGSIAGLLCQDSEFKIVQQPQD